MVSLQSALAANRDAVHQMLDVADQSAAHWMQSPAAGKWSPSQIVEHVALTLDESTKAMSGAPSGLPSFPFIVRPLVKALFFNRVLKTGVFPKGKAVKAISPQTVLDSPARARQRMEDALAGFDGACRQRAKDPAPLKTAAFGAVPLVDMIRFTELHTRHHTAQMSSRGSA